MDHVHTQMLWRALYGEQPGLIGVHSALRPVPGDTRLSRHRPAFFEYPKRARAAAAWCLHYSEAGFESFFCAHLLTSRRRTKANAAPVLSLWADADEFPLRVCGGLADGAPPPTAIVESSPGQAHLFWRLRRPVSPEAAESLNRRLLIAVGADRSGWDLSQLLRPPVTKNHKYEPSPIVRLVELDEGISYHPRELDLALPGPTGRPVAAPARPGGRPCAARCRSPALSQLTPRMQTLIRHGNAAISNPYPSRSEADFAVCVAMFGAGYEEADVWAVMADPSNAVSGKYREKGRYGEGYLARTISKAREVALPYRDLPARAIPGSRSRNLTVPSAYGQAEVKAVIDSDARLRYGHLASERAGTARAYRVARSVSSDV